MSKPATVLGFLMMVGGAALAQGAKGDTADAVAKAVKANPGFHAASAMPSFQDGHPMAEVTLVKGDTFKKVSEKLD